MDIEQHLISTTFNSFAPLVAEVKSEDRQDELVEAFLSALYDTLAELRTLQQTKTEWTNSVASLYRQERNRRFNL